MTFRNCLLLNLLIWWKLNLLKQSKTENEYTKDLIDGQLASLAPSMLYSAGSAGFLWEWWDHWCDCSKSSPWSELEFQLWFVSSSSWLLLGYSTTQLIYPQQWYLLSELLSNSSQVASGESYLSLGSCHQSCGGISKDTCLLLTFNSLMIKLRSAWSWEIWRLEKKVWILSKINESSALW